MSEQRKIVEDSPQMRSVAMHSSMPMMPRVAPLARSKAALAPPLVTKSQVTTGSLWNVQQAPRLPSMYFLERTVVHIADASPQQVASRIVECLRAQSVAAVYHDKEALVVAESQECVQFAIRLWESKNQIAVEVQRSSGCSYAFHQLAKTVLQASKGLSRAPSPSRFALPKCIPRQTDQERKECLKEGLEIAVSLLQNDAIDSQLMAMESLAHLSKVCTIGFAAESIMEHAEIRTRLFSLVEDSANTDTQQSNSELDNSNLTTMRRQAITVLANCLDSLKEHNKLHACVNRHSDLLLSETLLMALLSRVSNAQEMPHEACQATRCLASLTEASTVSRRRALELDASKLVQQAHFVATRRHAQLQGLTSKLQLHL